VTAQVPAVSDEMFDQVVRADLTATKPDVATDAVEEVA
jgi:hypothetical protein